MQVLLQEVKSADECGYFANPVDAEALGLTTYRQVIQRPMDLATVADKLRRKLYTGPTSMATDLRLMLSNARLFTPDCIHPVHVCALRLDALIDRHLNPSKTKNASLAINHYGCLAVMQKLLTEYDVAEDVSQISASLRDLVARLANRDTPTAFDSNDAFGSALEKMLQTAGARRGQLHPSTRKVVRLRYIVRQAFLDDLNEPTPEHRMEQERKNAPRSKIRILKSPAASPAALPPRVSQKRKATPVGEEKTQRTCTTLQPVAKPSVAVLAPLVPFPKRICINSEQRQQAMEWANAVCNTWPAEVIPAPAPQPRSQTPIVSELAAVQQQFPTPLIIPRPPHSRWQLDDSYQDSIIINHSTLQPQASAAFFGVSAPICEGTHVIYTTSVSDEVARTVIFFELRADKPCFQVDLHRTDGKLNEDDVSQEETRMQRREDRMFWMRMRQNLYLVQQHYDARDDDLTTMKLPTLQPTDRTTLLLMCSPHYKLTSLTWHSQVGAYSVVCRVTLTDPSTGRMHTSNACIIFHSHGAVFPLVVHT